MTDERANPLPQLGLGIGWRPEIAGVVGALPGLRFTEVIAESLRPGKPLPPGLDTLRERGVTVIPHGTRLSLGGTDPLEPDRVSQFAGAAATVAAPLASEHIAFVRAGGIEAGHLLPLPRTHEALDVLERNIATVTAELDVPLALEPIATLFDWPEDELSEADFLTELLERTDTWLLLDVANVYANAVNRGINPVELLERLPLQRVAYVHVAGGEQCQGLYHDTHTATTPPEVLALVTELCDRHRPPALLLERDGGYPPAAQLYTELDTIADAAKVGRITGPMTPAGQR